MKNLFNTKIYALLIIAATTLQAQSDVSVTARTNRDTVAIGENFVYELNIRVPDTSVPIGEPAADFSDAEVVQIRRLEPLTKDGTREEKIQYILSGFKLEPIAIPGPSLRYLIGKDTLFLRANDKTIFIRSELDSAMTDIQPEKPIFYGEVRWWLIALYVLITIGVLAGAAWLIYRWYKKRQELKNRPKPEPVVIPKKPHEAALEALDALKISGYPERGDMKLWHSEASTIIRIYIEKQFGVPALETTTSELIPSLKRSKIIADADVTILRRMLEVCDLAKFAKYMPSVDDCYELLELAYSFVRHTMPAGEAPPEVKTGV
ncbi:MAG TPA: hypothetical protein PLH27_14525 [bacterium]|nr:hypothetical protein [bacterium]HMW35138.1 hypothetical protein [bacterium]HMZ04937.1 hypothetical protein [bacterium]HNB10128.1 hypothetical protein [bacterium]HNC50203.1 hypothetical protein [bacterium]